MYCEDNSLLVKAMRIVFKNSPTGPMFNLSIVDTMYPLIWVCLWMVDACKGSDIGGTISLLLFNGGPFLTAVCWMSGVTGADICAWLRVK
ncbi:hypothetical protein WICPIJ_000551 [Wickerhamomyces pijperi]|uniref:Uncharacterized protein n=1 Tax=Wickerhamomyces pijperi TaxID=599730 RepID=A0A9P8QCA0_WICPI|nr:hypothetical protein WICPIJ_000551 [Wickerhamomyces pijperi]